MRRLEPGTKPLPDRSVGILAAATVIAAALAVFPWLPPSFLPLSFLPFGAHSAARGAAPASASGAALGALSPLPPLTRFAETVERPLFSPSRRPPSAVARSAAPGAALAKTYHLLGLIDDGGERRALVASAHRSFEIGEGAMLDGWRVLRIAQDRLVLSSAAGTAVLRLHDGEAAAPDAGEALPAPPALAPPSPPR